MGVMNLATYGYTVLAAHTLGTEAYGAFSALMGALLVDQRALARPAGHRRPPDLRRPRTTWSQIERVVLGVGATAAPLVLGALCLLLAPVLNAVLHLDSLPTALLVGVAAVPLTYHGRARPASSRASAAGGRWRWSTSAQGVGRLGCRHRADPLVSPTEFAAMLGVALGALAARCSSAGSRCARPRRRRSPQRGAPRARPAPRGRPQQPGPARLLRALQRRHPGRPRDHARRHQAGLYAGGLILTKAVLFLPQFVVVVAFPSMSTARSDAGATLLLA